MIANKRCSLSGLNDLKFWICSTFNSHQAFEQNLTPENLIMQVILDTAIKQETIRVSALHALAYCPRLYYLEEVEKLYTQNAAIFAGRRLHAELEKQEEENWEDLFLTSEELGLRGKVDALRTRDGKTIPYEHKRGRCCRDENKQPQAWDSDRLYSNKK